MTLRVDIGLAIIFIATTSLQHFPLWYSVCMLLRIMLLCFVQVKGCTIKNNNAEY
jgi:hypothetical protein